MKGEMKMEPTKRNKRGFTLVEIAIVLVIITVLLLVIGPAAKGIFDNGRVNSAAQSVETLRNAAAQYLASGNVTYASVSVTALKDGNLLPTNFNATGSNPYGGDYSIVANGTDNTKVDITLTSIPENAGSKLNSYFANKADTLNYDATSSTWTATF